MKIKTVLGLFFLSFILAGCNTTLPVKDEKYCKTVDDCACGRNIKTGECFLGNKEYVNTLKQCPDFCTGIAGNFEFRCVNNECTQVNMFDEKYCDVDSDCVRKHSCCDCGPGNYINKKYQKDVACKGSQCACKTIDSIGKCIKNECTAVEKQQTNFCGTSTLGSCSSDSDCILGGCSGQVCQSNSEEPIITTCEYTDCYNADAYNLKCSCFNNQCQWREK